MPQCKKCGDIFGVTEMDDGVCRYCTTGEEKPKVAVKEEAKSHLTDEEIAKIIQEEELRAKIRNQNDPVSQEINGFKKDFLIYLLVIGVPAVVLIIMTL